MSAVMRASFLAGLFLISSNIFATAQEISVDTSHSKIKFLAKTSIFDSEGKFHKFQASGKVDPKNLRNSNVKIVIDVASIDTDSAQRDKHLRNPDFFDVKKFPEATFVTTKIKIKNAKNSTYYLEGNLTIHGISKKVIIPVKVSQFAYPANKGFVTTSTRVKGTFTIKRQDYGINYKAGVLMPAIKDMVEIMFDVNMDTKEKA